MTGFAVGMLAALLWIVAMIGVGYLLRSSPGHPFRTIRRFRLAGRSLGEVPVSEPDPVQEAPAEQQVAPFHELEISVPDWAPPEAASDWTAPEPPRVLAAPKARTELSQEVLALVGLGTPADQPSRPATARSKPAPAKKGPRRNGRIEYIVVDRDGRPET